MESFVIYIRNGPTKAIFNTHNQMTFTFFSFPPQCCCIHPRWHY